MIPETGSMVMRNQRIEKRKILFFRQILKDKKVTTIAIKINAKTEG